LVRPYRPNAAGIRFGGHHGAAHLHGNPGYITVESTMYRIFDITIPVIVNDVWQQAA
jgi:hypothetical protein